MVRSDVVAYLRDNIKKFPVEDLRIQLAAEGVTQPEFDASLTQAMAPPPAPAPPKGGAMSKVLLFGGLGAILGAAALMVLQKSGEAPSTAPLSTTGSTGAESGFVGHYGYVLRLPDDYAAVQSFKDKNKTIEVVHFCKSGTDATNFLNEGLYGQMGIVRLEVRPNPFSGDPSGLQAVTSTVTGKAQQRGEKFTVKDLQISTLRGVQITYEAPFPRIEAYILGNSMLFSVAAGQDDEIYRQLVQSLRDARSEI